MARIWDKYLSERDLEHVVRKPKRPVGYGTRPALLLIDNYRSVLGTTRENVLEAMGEWPWTTGADGWRAVDHSRTLLQAARDAGIPVVHITALDPLVTNVPMWIDTIHQDRSLNYRPGAYEIVEELAPIKGEIVLRKNAPSAFWGTPLAGVLHDHGCDTVLVCGATTGGCVRATVVEAASHRYRVNVVEECVYDRHEASHAINLFDMDQKYADVVPLAGAVEYLGGSESAHRVRDAELTSA